MNALGDEYGRMNGLPRRRFFQTAAGMAAAFVAMNDIYGPLFGVSRAEAGTPSRPTRAPRKLAGQFIMDMHTHFLRDGTRLETFVRSATPSARRAGTRARRQGADDRRSEVPELLQGDLSRQRHQGRVISGAPSEIRATGS